MFNARSRPASSFVTVPPRRRKVALRVSAFLAVLTGVCAGEQVLLMNDRPADVAATAVRQLASGPEADTAAAELASREAYKAGVVLGGSAVVTLSAVALFVPLARGACRCRRNGGDAPSGAFDGDGR